MKMDRKEFISVFRRGFKNVSIMTVGNIIATLVSLGGYIFFVRFLELSELGTIGVVESFVMIFSFFTLNQMSKVLIREGAKDFSTLRSIYQRTVGIKTVSIILSMFICLSILLFMPYSSEVQLYILIYSVNLIFMGYRSFFNAGLIAKERFMVIEVFNILTKIIYVVLSVTFLLLGSGVIAIFIVSVVTNITMILVLYLYSRRFVKFRFFSRPVWDWKLMKPTFIFTILLFLGMVATRIDLIMISLLGPLSDVGSYDIVLKSVAPFSLIKNYISLGFFPIVVKLFHRNKLKISSVIRFSMIFGILTIMGAGVLSLLSEPLLGLVYGSNASDSVGVFSVLVFYLAFSFMAIPFSLSLQATHHELDVLKVAWIPPIFNIGLNIVFYNMFGLVGIAYSTMAVFAMYYFILLFMSWRLLRKYRVSGVKA